jgi:hypothetical protein
MKFNAIETTHVLLHCWWQGSLTLFSDTRRNLVTCPPQVDCHWHDTLTPTTARCTVSQWEIELYMGPINQ